MCLKNRGVFQILLATAVNTNCRTAQIEGVKYMLMI
jgi:hypothetical protein